VGLPTPRGLAQLLDLSPPADLDDEAATLHAAARVLLGELAAQPQAARLRSIAWAMARGGWPWGAVVLAALGLANAGDRQRHMVASLAIWDDLPEWAEHAPEPPPGNVTAEPLEARPRLSDLLGLHAQARPPQA